MESEEEVRAALRDVRRGREAVNRELDRHRPRWWMTALYVLGIYMAMASTELGVGISLLVAGAGFALLVLSVGLAVARASRSGVGAPRAVWTPARIAAGVAWIAGMVGVFILARMILSGSLAEWQVPLVAGVPAAGVAWLFALWLWRISFGPRRPAAPEVA